MDETGWGGERTKQQGVVIRDQVRKRLSEKEGMTQRQWEQTGREGGTTKLKFGPFLKREWAMPGSPSQEGQLMKCCGGIQVLS